MNSDTLLTIVIGLALLVWIGYRQLNWTPVAPDRMWRMPGLLAIIGVFLLVKDGAVQHVSGTDVAVLAIETVISLGIGAVMGAIAHIRPMSDDAIRADAAKNSGRSSGALPTVETRNGWFGMALWLVLIATRVGGEFLAHANHSQLLMSTGVILVTIALNRGVRILVITQRAQRHPVLADASR